MGVKKKRKYFIKFYDGWKTRRFSFFAKDKNDAIIKMWEILESDNYKRNNQSKIISFDEYE